MQALAAELDEEVIKAADEDSPGTLSRLPKVLTFIKGALASADPDLVSLATLEAIDTALSNAESQLGRVVNVPAAASSLDTHLETALQEATALVTVSPLPVDRSKAAAKRFDTALMATVKNINDQAGKLAAELAAVEERRAEAEQERQAADQARETSLAEKMDELTASVDSEKQRLDSLVPQFETQFKAAQDERTETFDALEEELKTNSAAVVSELKESFEKTTAQLSDTAQAALEDVESKRKEVERLHGVITDTSTTGAFRKEAKEQKDAADHWRVVTVVFGSVAALLAIGSVVASAVWEDAATSTSAIIAKTTATLVAAGIAAYAGRQSGRHRRREEEAKRLELELVAFPPFIDSLDDDQKREVRKEFAERAFRGRPGDPEPEPLLGLFRKEDSVGLGVPELLDIARRLNAPPDAGGK